MMKILHLTLVFLATLAVVLAVRQHDGVTVANERKAGRQTRICLHTGATVLSPVFHMLTPTAFCTVLPAFFNSHFPQRKFWNVDQTLE